MPAPVLLQYYLQLPVRNATDDEDLWNAGAQEALRDFREAVRWRYTEGTLNRLLTSDHAPTRQAAVLALGVVGTMESNPAVVGMLGDDDPLVRRFAGEAAWEIWFRAGTDEQNWQLQLAVREPDVAKTKSLLDDLLRVAPEFAEAYNQRAIWYFNRGEFARSAEDCQMTLQFNPFHFGASAGLGQCYLKLGKPQAALRAFRHALDVNPNLDHLTETVRALEDAINNGPPGGE